ncbi:disulfide bond formation protein B [Parvularcula sp. IMCC14364]|uniref:disulfide bond formation protein B n=1 Tax=Parvularcula sp. IMCC14364 TaxID=3067902 RepID=UPI002742691B|nr:disulfide bond formation protein B [Parvularcula sp. IMCC14364]
MMGKFFYLLTIPVRALLICGLASAGLLAAAHLFERVGDLPPCALCLDQREVHWAALAVFVIARGVIVVTNSTRALTIGLIVMILVYGYSTWLSGYHAGVEWKWWPGPETCSATTDLSGPINPLDALGDTVVPCTEAAWRLFGISMAGYNFLISLGLMMLAAAGAWRNIASDTATLAGRGWNA